MDDLLKKLDAEPILRILAYFYKEVLRRPQPGFWVAPGAITLLGGADLALATGTQWGATVAVERRPGEAVELRSMNRPAECYEVPVAELGPPSGAAPWPAWATEALAVVWTLREAGFPIAGTAIVLHSELPRACVLTTPVAVGCATAIAFRDEYGFDFTTDNLIGLVTKGLDAFGFHGPTEALVAAAMLLGDDESVRYDGGAKILPFDLVAAGLRLLIVDPRSAHDPQGSRSNDDELAAAAVDVLERGRPEGLGPLLTAAHRAHAAGPDQDAVVEAALAAGALGARALTDLPGAPVIVLLPAVELGPIRSAITRNSTERGCQAPWFITAGAVRRQGRAE